jgi:putative toxin-antitoxin system antitoxin component (TIGR02293 family)
MSGFAEAQSAFTYGHDHQATSEVLDLLGTPLSITDQWAAHDLCAAGLPGTALEHLVGSVGLLQTPEHFEAALGMSIRTYQRRREEPEKCLSPEQSGRVWVFAEIFAKAVSVFGLAEDAETWMLQPALGLDGRRPIDLLSSPAGVSLLADFLGRLEYGVYT